MEALKRALLIIAAFTIITMELVAQGKIVEFKVGGLLSKGFSSGSYSSSSKILVTLPMAGVSLYTKAKKNFCLMYGIEYQKLGGKYLYYTGFNYERTNVNITVNSIKIPVMACFIGKFKNSAASFFKIGPSLDFVFNGSKIDPASKLNDPDGFRANIDQGYVSNQLNLGINVSTGAIIDSPTSRTIFELRYNQFITNTFPNTKFGTIAFSVGFQLCKKQNLSNS